MRRIGTNFPDGSFLRLYCSLFPAQVSERMSVICEGRVRGGVFKDINADEEDAQPTEIESLCMSCYENVSG